ncbi:MAG: hypothetical protein LBB60_09480 [Desulfovibrio sp.]|jgi:two-component system sensor histidine kinase HydH|nr:hypothetical protein [Desulfovibrio sp.]
MLKDFSRLSPASRRFFGFSPWLFIGIAAIFGIAITIMAAGNVRREKEYMTQNLTDRAESLIWALEAGARTWMGMHSGGNRQLQPLVEETAKRPGVVFLAVTDMRGEILAHSDPQQIGARIAQDLLPSQDVTSTIAWRLRSRDGETIFEVYRLFSPFSPPHHARGEGRRGMRGGPRMMPDRTTPDRIIFVGLDQQPFEDALADDFKNTLLSAALVAALALAGFVSLFWAHNYRHSRRLLKDARAFASEQARRNENLTSLGNLAAGVAHEIRNPLSTIKVLATYLAKTFPPGGSEENAAKTMVAETDRLNRVVTELLEFARPGALKLSETDVHETVARALRLAEADIKAKNIVVRLEEDPAIPRVSINPERFIQALLNVFLNAVQAMEPGGELRVACRLQAGGDSFRVVISDTGKGIPEEALESIFTPYFTTKASGTGLGLAIVQQVVESHGGSITAQSRPGTGSAFTMTLPVKAREIPCLQQQ